MDANRIERFRHQVADCEARAAAARTPENRRAWLIAARGWRLMAEREALKYLEQPAATLIPTGSEVEDALKELAQRARE